MYTQMLVPLDGSETAEKVLPYARTLARTLKTSVELVAVTETLTLTAGKARHLDILADTTRRRNQEYLQRVVGTFSGVSVHYTVEAGVPEEVIITKAAANKGTLIAMATHGRSGLRRWLLGSIAEKVLRGASNPVLLVRAKEKAETRGEVTPNRIIVPLDGSELAETVLPTVVKLATAINLKVTLLRSYSVEHFVRSDVYNVSDLLDKIKEELKKEAITYLDGKAQQLKNDGLVDVFPLTSDGEAAETIIASGRGAPNSLIAMCTHGRSGVMRWMLGSITEKVVRHSDNPVLVIRAK